MNPDGFLRDILVAPERLAGLLDAYEGASSPLAALGSSGDAARRTVFIGMGSSRFAAVAAAAHLRSQGLDAYAELASTGSRIPPSVETLAVGISASGKTPETVEALEAHRGTSRCVAITNDPESDLAGVADLVLPLLAGHEEGGVACLTYQATVAVLLLAAGRMTDDRPRVADLRPSVEAAAHIRDGRSLWLDDVVGLVEDARTVGTIAPAERLSSALQSALMLREGPRVVADAAETGDWLHVDLYLSKRPRYAALLLTGSRFGTRACSSGLPSARFLSSPSALRSPARPSTSRSRGLRARLCRCSSRPAWQSSSRPSCGTAGSPRGIPLSSIRRRLAHPSHSGRSKLPYS